MLIETIGNGGTTVAGDVAHQRGTVPPLGISFPLPLTSRTREMVELTQLADGLGFDSVWMPEAWGRDAFTTLAALAVQTSRIRLATGIVNVFSRTPALVGQSIASLDDISGGRALLGLGVSGARVIEDWHGLRFERLLQRTREFVDVVRLVASGSAVNYDGEIYRLRDFSLAFKPFRPNVPIFLASMGPANVRLTGAIADGWLPIFASEQFLVSGRQWLHSGAMSAGRDPGSIVTAAYIPALISEDAPRLLRGHIAHYVGAMGSYYYRLMVRSGFEGEATLIRDLMREGRRIAAADAVSEPMMAAICLYGRPDEAREKLATFRARGVGLPILTFPADSNPRAIRATLEALAGT